MIWTLIQPVVLVLVVWRIAFSVDPDWQRIGAIAVLGFKWIAPPLVMYFTIGQGSYRYMSWYTGSSLVLPLIPAAYMLFWAIRSRDKIGLRLVSAAYALMLCGPLLAILAMWALTMPR